MSRLIALRQRIKTATTIQKTTHAMRLTSMSAHARLQRKKEYIKTYKQQLEGLMYRLGLEEKIKKVPTHPMRRLILIVGSQKGLCGAFNTRIMRLAEEKQPNLYKQGRHLLVIGKKITDYLEQQQCIPQYSYPIFTPSNFLDIAHEIMRIIFDENGYEAITIYSNHPQTFFLQKSMETTIIKSTLQEVPGIDQRDPYYYEQPAHEPHQKVQQLYFKACFEELLFNSLIAEQAARCIAMDNATRNAETILLDIKRDYSKLRQASITRELTDLAGGVL